MSVTTNVLEDLAVKLVTALVEAIGVDGLTALLNKHPLTAGKIIASERAASDAILDEEEANALAGEKKP